MTTDSAKHKLFSVVLPLAQFDTLNGKLSTFQDMKERRTYLDNFFESKYGQGAGQLEIRYSPTKVKLSWFPQRYVAQAEKAHFEAVDYAKNKQLKQAVGSWVKAIALNPADPDYYFNLGIAFFELKNYQEAIENLLQTLELCPIYHKAHLILGTVYLKVRKFEQAEKYLQESLIFYPQHPLAYLNLGAVYSIMKRYTDGIKMFVKSIELSSNEVRAHFGIAKIYSLQNETEKANKYFENVITINSNEKLTIHAKRLLAGGRAVEIPQSTSATIDPADAERYYQEGYRAYIFGDYQRSVKMYETYLAGRPDDDFVWFSLGEASLRCGNLLGASKAFKKAIAANSGKGLYYKELAIALNQLGNETEAIEMLQKGEQFGKSDSISSTIWGKVLIKQGKFDEACGRLEKALKLDTNNLLAKYNLAIALMRKNQNQEAASYLHEIVKAPVKSPIKMEAENLLREM